MKPQSFLPSRRDLLRAVMIGLVGGFVSNALTLLGSEFMPFLAYFICALWAGIRAKRGVILCCSVCNLILTFFLYWATYARILTYFLTLGGWSLVIALAIAACIVHVRKEMSRWDRS